MLWSKGHFRFWCSCCVNSGRTVRSFRNRRCIYSEITVIWFHSKRCVFFYNEQWNSFITSWEGGTKCKNIKQSSVWLNYVSGIGYIKKRYNIGNSTVTLLLSVNPEEQAYNSCKGICICAMIFRTISQRERLGLVMMRQNASTFTSRKFLVVWSTRRMVIKSIKGDFRIWNVGFQCSGITVSLRGSSAIIHVKLISYIANLFLKDSWILRGPESTDAF